MNPILDIVPISELRKDTSAVVNRTAETGSPVYVTQHGRASVVVLSVSAYQKTIEEMELLKMLLHAQRDIDAGLGRDIADVMADADAIISRS